MILNGTAIVCNKPIPKSAGMMSRFGEVGRVIHTSPARKVAVIKWPDNEISIVLVGEDESRFSEFVVPKELV